ncbi:unnamed protein product, partial [Prorocentrum cordatum]
EGQYAEPCPPLSFDASRVPTRIQLAMQSHTRRTSQTSREAKRSTVMSGARNSAGVYFQAGHEVALQWGHL